MRIRFGPHHFPKLHHTALAAVELAAGAVCKYFPFRPNPIPATWASEVVSIGLKE